MRSPTVRGLILSAAIPIAGLFAAQAAATPTPMVSPVLSQKLAEAAVNAERTAPRPDRDSVRAVVSPALQQVVIRSGQPPLQVKAAIEGVLLTCRTTDGRNPASAALSCPASPGSYAALSDLLGVVQALLDDDVVPAGADVGLGAPAYASATGDHSGGGGSGYRSAR